jgi:branched-chain amino acid transport system permease protein
VQDLTRAHQSRKAERWLRPAALLAAFLLCLAASRFGLLNNYLQLILMYVGINIILTVSLNLVNGYMGEFSVGHAGFMAVGAYTSAVLSVRVFPENLLWALFPAVVLAGGLAAALSGLLVAIPSFRTRGDYLAIVTLAYLMIVKSAIENMEVIGGARGFLGISKLTTLPVVFVWTAAALWLARNLVFSNLGRGALAIREDETTAEIMGVDTRRVKLLVFLVSAFLAGVAGGLYAHLLQFINPRSFDILKSTEMLVMVYLGGIGSISGSILGATVYTALLELLRPLGVWRMVLMPLLLVLLMILRPRGIMGLREVRWLRPRDPGPDAELQARGEA